MAKGERPFRVCITGSEADQAALSLRLSNGNPGDLHEIRLDLLGSISGDVFDLIRESAHPIVATCRSRQENGGFAGTESQRLALLAQAAVAGAAYVDLELDAIEAGAAGVLPKGTPIIGSLHASDMGTARRAVGRLAALPVAIRKFAVLVEGAADLVALRQTGMMLPGAAVVMGMGPAGLWSRLRPADFGSAWTYVASRSGMETAAGQLSLGDAQQMGLLQSASLAPFALVGGDNVLGSPGAAAHNRVFRRLGIPFQHVPLPARSWQEALAACSVFGVSWAAVTMPFKEEAMGGGALPDPWARAAGSSNTRFLGEPGASTMPGITAWNTDAPASLGLLRDLGVVPGHRVLILGKGATARAVAHAVTMAGAKPILACRNPSQAGGGPWETVPWESRHDVACDCLVQTTPVGTDGRSCPWDGDRALPSRVMDLALAPGNGTVLVQRARDEGADARDGLDFWCTQGSMQASIVTGQRIDTVDLEGALVAAGLGIPSPGVAEAL